MKRRAIACLSALLIVFQMVAVPFASALASGATSGDCDHAGTVHPWHGDDDCGHDHGNDRGPTQHSSGAGHACHCVHAVAHAPVAGDLLVTLVIRPDLALIATQLQGPAFAAPLFDLLRPPK